MMKRKEFEGLWQGEIDAFEGVFRQRAGHFGAAALNEIVRILHNFFNDEFKLISKKQIKEESFESVWAKAAAGVAARMTHELFEKRFSTLDKFNKSEIAGEIIDILGEILQLGSTNLKNSDDVATSFLSRLSHFARNIDDELMRINVSHLLKISEQIFEFVEKNPEKKRKLHTFVDYYFPTTLKLLENYEQLSKKAAKGENITASLAQIDEALQKIKQAFAAQLDALFADVALDIKTDIVVLNNTIKQNFDDN